MDKSENENGFISCVLKGICIALIITLLSALIFAFVIKTAGLKDGTIRTVNAFIKVASVFSACFFVIKDNMGLLKGLIIGLFSVAIGYLVMSALSGSVSFGLKFIIDLAFGAVCGSISGVIAVNAKK